MKGGDIIGYHIIGEKNGRYVIECDVCHRIKDVSKTNYKKQNLDHSERNCKEMFYQQYVGMTIGDYDILSYKDKRFECKCKICGHVASVSHHYIDKKTFMHGAATCGQTYYDNLVGKQFKDCIIKEVQKVGNDREVVCLVECAKCGTRFKFKISDALSGFNHGLICTIHIPRSKYKDVILNRFSNIVQRCNNPNNTNYAHYGARGIKCEYEYPVDFYYDVIDELIEHSKKYGLRNSTFDRIDVNGNYCKGNIRVTTQSVQSTNTVRKTYFAIEKDDEIIISDNAMAVGKLLNVNGRAIGNLIRGTSKKSYGWKLICRYDTLEKVENDVKDKNVTTKLITT